MNDAALLRNAENGDVPGMRLCLRKGADVNADNAAALGSCVEKRNAGGLNLLFEHKVNVHLNEGKEFLKAVQMNAPEIVTLMLERAPSLMRYQENALMLAAMCPFGFPNVLTKMLENFKFSQQAKNYALVYAAHLNHEHNVHALCEEGAMLSSRDMSDIQSALTRKAWTQKTIETLSNFPQNTDMLYVCAVMFDREDIERLPALNHI